MKPQKGKNFQLVDIDGTIFNLYRYQSNSRLLLIFFRGEWCQYCRKQLLELKKHFSWFEKMGIKIVALSSDDQLFTSIYRAILKPPFPILSDHAGKVFQRYGIKWYKDYQKIKPALFLLNAEHEIKYNYIGKNKNDRPTINQLKKACKKYI